MSAVDTLRAALAPLATAPPAARVAIFNEAIQVLAALVADVTTDPACQPQLLPLGKVEANDYNPNRVATTEMDLLEDSMRADGITMPVVVVEDADRGCWIVVDGFHRHQVAAARLGRAYLPCSVIAAGLAHRMASTIRHNRARGKHQVDLMAALVRSILALGWDDVTVAAHLGMSPEELLRLRQMVGAARVLAGEEYTLSWGTIDADPSK